MGIYYENLDQQTREFMLKELELSISNGSLYISSRLNEQGRSNWEYLLREAIKNNDDTWLASQLRKQNYLKSEEERHLSGGRTTIARVPTTAADTLAEGEFNRFYSRGLCARALASGVLEVEVYRGKEVQQPRPESETKIGNRFAAGELLEDLRKSKGVEPALGIPPGPNTGITIKLP